MKYINNNWDEDEDSSWILCNTEDEVFEFNNYLEALEGRRLHLVKIGVYNTFSNDHYTKGYRFVLHSALPTEVVRNFIKLMEE